MPRDIKTILKLRVPVIVRIGEKRMPLDDVLSLSPGAIIELPKPAERPLDLMVNNKVIGLGNAVKIGENFGIRVLEVGDANDRIRAIAGQQAANEAANAPAEASTDSDEAPADDSDAADDAAKAEDAAESREDTPTEPAHRA